MYQPKSIVKGTALLTGAAIIVKLLGAAYRIPLARLIGPEGMGLYQMAYPVYLIFLSLSTAGIPIAISRLVAEAISREDQYTVRKIFRASFWLLFLLGVTGAIGMAFTAQWFSKNIVADSRSLFAMWALAPAILFMSLMAAFRGFFQGQQDMKPSAISQVIEQWVRVGVALVLAFSLYKIGIEHAAAGAAFGATAGGIAGLLFLIYHYWRETRFRKKLTRRIPWNELLFEARRLIRFALPISLAVILMPLLQTIDTFIVPARLQGIGYTIKEATAMLGILGNSWAVVYLPLVVTAAISSNLVPAIAGLKTLGHNELLKGKIREGLRLALLYLVPAAAMFLLFGQTIYKIIYGQSGVGLVVWFAPAVLFLGLEQVTAGILQGIGQPHRPLIHFCIGATVKIGVTVFATGWPGLNLAGAALGTVCGSVITAGLNIWRILKLVNNRSTFPAVTGLAGVAMIITCWYVQRVLRIHFAAEMIIIGVGGCLLYLGLLWLMGGIRRRDLEVIRELISQRRHRNGKSNRSQFRHGTPSGNHDNIAGR